MKRRALVLGFALAAFGLARPCVADEPLRIDQAVVRFHAPELGGPAAPHFIFERELAFEARIEALAERAEGAPYRQRHVAAALERHIAETLLAALLIDPEPSEAELATQTRLAQGLLAQRVGGPERLEQARRAEGISRRELARLLRRRARASLYLDRMIAPMFAPTELQLQATHQRRRHPFVGVPYAQAKSRLRRWYISRQLNQALTSFYQNARGRLSMTFLSPLGRPQSR